MVIESEHQDSESSLYIVRSVLEGIRECACLIDCETFRIILSNARMRQDCGPDTDAPCYKRFHGRDAPCPNCPMLRYAEQGQETANLAIAFETYWEKTGFSYSARLSFLTWLDGRLACLSIFSQRTECSLRERELEVLAYSDEKTGVANNRRFEIEGPEILERVEGLGQKAAIIALKVEGLHHINSVQGYEQGDALLKSIATGISRILPEKALFARRRGNDFSILYPLEALREEEELDELLANLETVIVNMPGGGKERFRFRICLGVSLYPEHERSFEGLNRKARQAVSTCMDGIGIFSHAVYNGARMSDLRRRETLKQELVSAVRNNQLSLLFQPQHEMRSSRIVGAEALVRWNHPVYGQVGANEFIPIAEESLFIHILDEWVIDAACRQWRELFDAGCPVVPISINISPQKFYQSDLLDVLSDAMARHMLMPGMLEIELTERTALQDIDKAIEIMKLIRGKGIRIAMDDFGTGYSSLNYLRALSFDVIKLDQTFVMDTSDRGKAVLRTIVSLARAYNSLVIFEGVETEAQYHFARQIGCDLVQGYFTGRPMPAEELADMLAGQRHKVLNDNKLFKGLNHGLKLGM